jgi:hypothetical protein
MGEVWARAMEPDGDETDDEGSHGVGSNRPGLQIAVDWVLCGSGVGRVSEASRGIKWRGAMSPVVPSSAVAFPRGRGSLASSWIDLSSALPGCDSDGPECGRVESVAGRAADGKRGLGGIADGVGELDMSVTTRLVARFRRRLEIAVGVRGNTISQLQSSHMSPRPHGVWEGEIALFTPGDDLLRRDRMQGPGRHLE